MSRTPMPSPNGTNRAGLYFMPGTRAAVAYDAAPGEPGEPQDFQAVIEFLSDKLERADLVKVCRMLGLDDEAGEAGAEDRRRRVLRGANDRKPNVPPSPVRYDSATFPNASRLKG